MDFLYHFWCLFAPCHLHSQLRSLPSVTPSGWRNAPLTNFRRVHTDEQTREHVEYQAINLDGAAAPVHHTTTCEGCTARRTRTNEYKRRRRCSWHKKAHFMLVCKKRTSWWHAQTVRNYSVALVASRESCEHSIRLELQGTTERFLRSSLAS